MKTVIFCGGLGTRLREETEFKPKPLVEIGGKPILWHIMKIYSHYGFNEFILCLGYKGDMIKDYFYNYDVFSKDFTIDFENNKKIITHSNHSENNWKITLVDTGEDSLKGARLKRVEKYIDGDIFMATYGDGLADINIGELIKFHKGHGKIGTLSGVHPVSRFGEIIEEGGVVKKFEEKPQNKSNSINGGFFVFNRSVFNYLEDKDECDLEYGVLDKMAEKGELMVFKHFGFWHCLDTPRDFEYLKKINQNRNTPWKVWQK